jgi:hypothetical protein
MALSGLVIFLQMCNYIYYSMSETPMDAGQHCIDGLHIVNHVCASVSSEYASAHMSVSLGMCAFVHCDAMCAS